MTKKIIPLDVELARTLGINEAIFIGQLRYWLRKSKHEIDGRKWIYNPLREWVDQLPIGVWAIRNVIESLKNKEVLLVANFNKVQKLDRTKWFSLDEQKLGDEKWLEEQKRQLVGKKQAYKQVRKLKNSHLRVQDKSSDGTRQMHLSVQDRTIPVDYIQEGTTGNLDLQSNADALKKSENPQNKDIPVETLVNSATPLSDYSSPPGLDAAVKKLCAKRGLGILPFELDKPLTPNEDGEFPSHAHQLIVDYGTSLNETAWWYADDDTDQAYTRRRIKENFQDGATVLGLCWSIYSMKDEIQADGLYDAIFSTQRKEVTT